MTVPFPLFGCSIGCVSFLVVCSPQLLHWCVSKRTGPKILVNWPKNVWSVQKRKINLLHFLCIPVPTHIPTYERTSVVLSRDGRAREMLWTPQWFLVEGHMALWNCCSVLPYSRIGHPVQRHKKIIFCETERAMYDKSTTIRKSLVKAHSLVSGKMSFFLFLKSYS